MKRTDILEKAVLILAGNLKYNKENCEKLEMFNFFTKKIDNETSFQIYLGNAKNLLSKFVKRENIYSSDRKKIEKFLNQWEV